MTTEEKVNAKKRAVDCRREGGNLYDCAVMAGIDEKTLYRWKDEDARFVSDLEEALVEFKKSLIRGTKLKRPEFILERRWKEEYSLPKEDPSQVTNNLIIMGDDALAQYLYGFTKRLSVSENIAGSKEDAAGGEESSLSTNGTGPSITG